MIADSVEADLRYYLDILSNEVISNLEEYKKDSVIGLAEVTYKIPIFYYEEVFKKRIIKDYEERKDKVTCISDSNKLKMLLKNCQSYSKCLELSLELYKHNHNDPQFYYVPENLLCEFCEQLIKKFNQALVIKYINLFIIDLKKKICHYHIKIFTYGITPENDYKIGNISWCHNLVIRKPVDDDYIISIGPYLVESEMSIMLQERNLPYNLTAIIEFDLEEESPEYSWDISWYIEVFLDVLRLARFGRIIPLKTEIHEISISPSLGFIPAYLKHGYIADIGYDLKDDEIPLFKELINKIFPLIPIDFKYNASSHLSLIDVAFKWFKDALLYEQYQIVRDDRIALVITSSMTSLGALYSTTTENASREIRERASILLSLYGFDNVKVNDNLKYAYQVRSAVLHGSKVSINSDTLKYLEKNRITPKEFYEIILNYNRISLLIYILLADKLCKDKSLSKELTYETKNIIINSIKTTSSNAVLRSEFEELIKYM